MKPKAIQVGKKINFRRQYENIPEILEYLVSEFPYKGSTYITQSGEEEFITYEIMQKLALEYLYVLQQKGVKPGDILMVETTNPKEFHILFWSCILGGIIITPLSQPTSWVEGSESIEVLKRLWSKLDKPIIITQEDHGIYYETMKDMKGLEEIRYITIGQLASTRKGVCYERTVHDVAYIQFSSGTTGDPQGAMLTNSNILSACTSTAHGLEIDDDGVLFSWLPHTHNLGTFVPFIVGMMQANNMFYMTPDTFISNPSLFVKKISEHHGSWFCINNFGLGWMTNKIPEENLEGIDLSSIQYIFPGAENISESVIESFYRKFEKYGMGKEVIRPGYGLTEATIAISLTPVGVGNTVEFISRKELLGNNRAVPVQVEDAQDGVSFTSNGIPLPGVTIRIADENGDTMDEDCVGEIQLQCKSIYKGYYGSETTVRSNVKNDWLCTGDLGYYHDGMLFIVGRKKDIIIIRGINYMVTDLEDIIYKNVEIPRGMLAITSVMNQEKHEEPVVFVQYKGALEDFVSLKKAISTSINEKFGLNLQNVIPLETILKTSSGKIKRYLMKMQYESGMYKELADKLEQLYNEPTQMKREILAPINEIQEFIRNIWAEVLNREAKTISIDDSFATLGGQSVQAYQMLSKISEYVGRELGHDMIATCKTIEDIYAYISKKTSNTEEKKEVKVESIGQNQKVAITGMAFRVPGAKDQDTFWENLCVKKDCIRQVSQKRKALANVKVWEDWIGELEDIDSFDYDFFEISKNEAKFMDPQQRLVMEVAYEALTDAGMIVDSRAGEKCIGVYSAISANTYYSLVGDYVTTHEIEKVNAKALVGNMNNIVSAHISHQHNFTGPVMAIDTACSSYMTALHYGSQAIVNKETEGAVIIGSNIIATPIVTKLAKKAGIISSTSKSKVFDAAADGSLLGEGIVVLYIETLQKAIEDNKHIYGVIEGSAINNDGFALSVMAPNPKGQFKVIEKAYANANIRPEQVSYIEAHGTGTRIGDPIEINALSRVFKTQRTETSKIGIGSVKTNIGHLLSAAGGVSLLKVLLCMQHKKLVPSLHMENINPLLEIEKTPFKVMTDLTEWEPTPGCNRIAGITSLGLGGTNAHVILSEWDNKVVASENKWHLLTVSAKTEKALLRAVEDMKVIIKKDHNTKLNDICFTANRYRRHYPYRAACIIDDANKENIEFLREKAFKGKPSHINIYIGQESEAWKCLVTKLRKVVSKEINVYIVNENKEIFIESDINMFFEDSSNDVDEKLFLMIIRQLYLRGEVIKWDILYPNGTGRLVNLPAYPFEKNCVWINK